MSEWTKGVVTGLVVGLVLAGIVFYSGRRAVQEIEFEMNRTIAQQRVELVNVQARQARCEAQFQASVQRQLMLEAAIRQHQNEMPVQVLAVLAKLLL